MAISTVKKSGQVSYGIDEYYLDTEEDVARLPIRDEVGSTATVISTGNVYKINSSGQWIKQPTSFGGSSSSSTTIIGNLPVDGKSVVFMDNVFAIAGFAGAQSGTSPVKQESGELAWEKTSSTIIGTLPPTANTIVEYIDQQIATTAKSININGTVINAIDGVINFPVATQESAGLIKGSTNENSIFVLEDGTVEINSLNVNKLTQTENDELILACGNAV